MISSRLSPILATTALALASLTAACNATAHHTGGNNAPSVDAPGAGTAAAAGVKKSDSYGVPADAAKKPVGTANSGAAGALPEAPAAADCYKGDPSLCKIEAEILRLTNLERAQPTGLLHRKPLAALKSAPKLSWVAREWSKTQGNRGNIGHDGFPDQREATFEGEFKGAQAEIQAENVAMTGWGSETDAAQQLFTMWKNSPGHYANMMGNYASMGIGVAKAGDGWYATEIFGDE